MLTNLDLSNNQLSTLNLSANTKLLTLNVSSNKLTALDLSKNLLLTSVNVSGNKLATLNLAANTALLTLDVSTNLLTALDLSKNVLLTSVKCFGYTLTTLNISNLVALLQLYLDNTGTSAINLLKFKVPVGATVQNLIANNASAAVNWTVFDCTGNGTIASISLQDNLLLTSVAAKANPQLLSLNVKGCLLTLAISTSGNKTGFSVTGPL